MARLKESGGFEARDPHVTYYQGYFYHCFTKDASKIYISKADSIDKLITTKPVCVYVPEEGKPYSKELWAPELHIIDNKCYIYVACDNGDNYNHRMYVLTNDSKDPVCSYHMLSEFSDSTNKWAIDGTIFKFKNEYYTIWSGWEGDKNVCQNLYIAKMKDPLTISSQRVMISTPQYQWEKMDCDGIQFPYINEGPCVYIKDGKLRVIYSASGSWANHYCMGILEFLGGDLLDACQWKKQAFPALSIEDGWNGPGHCSITTDNKTDYIAFHVYDEGKTMGWNFVHAVISPFKIVDGKIIIEN